MDLFHVARATSSVDFTTVAADKTLSLSVNVPADLKRRALHLGFCGSNWRATTSASGAFKLRLRLFYGNSMLHDVQFASVLWDENCGFPNFTVLKADPSSTGPTLDPTNISLLSGQPQAPGANALWWPYTDDEGQPVPAFTVVTHPFDFEGTIDRVTLELEPINTQTWQPVSADGVLDGFVYFVFGIVSKK